MARLPLQTGLPLQANGLFTMAAVAGICMLAPLSLAGGLYAQAGSSAGVQGRVVDAESGDGVQDAEVYLEGTRHRAATDGRGRFRLEGLSGGTYVIGVTRLGYETRADTLFVGEGELVEVVLPMGRTPLEIEGLEVEVTRRSYLLEMRGFYDRSLQGFRGTFLDRAAIEDRDPLFVTDLLRNIPGVEVVAGSRLIMSQSVNFYDGGRGCEPSLWLDGIRSGWRNYDDIRPDHLEGLEVYTGSGAPGKYNDLCGTVVIWTRLPMRRR
ncbi:MAG: carboxypeptidase regulatory-like domain-containing protein [Gemmatimonadales bacterium]|nr:MAG: carboxypeptidase regulatory-like domain-containing protein [Gemmatimonadales bacterium]